MDKNAFSLGFITGNLFLGGVLAYGFYKQFGGFTAEAIDNKSKKNLEKNPGFQYVKTLIEVVNEKEPGLLNDPRLEKPATNLLFDTITKNINFKD